MSSAIPRVLKHLAKRQFTGEALIRSSEPISKTGRIYFNKGSVTWAIACNQKESFQTILIDDHNIERSILLASLEESRTSESPNLRAVFGRIGIEDPTTIREVITRHIDSAICAMTQWQDINWSLKIKTGSSLEQHPQLPPSNSNAETLLDASSPEGTSIFGESDVHAGTDWKGLSRILSKVILAAGKGSIACALIDQDSGIPIGYTFGASCRTDHYDIENLCAYYTKIFNSCIVNLEAAHDDFRTNNPIKSISLTASNTQTLLIGLPNRNYFLAILLHSASDKYTNLKSTEPHITDDLLKQLLEEIEHNLAL